MNWKECKELIRQDYAQVVREPHVAVYQAVGWGGVKKLLSNASYKITFWFRIGSYLKEKRNPFWKLLYGIVVMIYKHNQFKTGIQLPLGTKVGGGIHFPHFGCQIINYASSIGEDVMIYQGVTIGSMQGKGGAPKIGNRVVLFSGACIIGDVTIGDNCVIGAGSVVTKDILSGCVAAGMPAKVVSQRGEDIVNRYLVK